MFSESSLLIATVTAFMLVVLTSSENPTHPISTRVLGRSCTYDFDCSVSVQFSHCLQGICTCQEGYIHQGDRCLIRTNEECPGATPSLIVCADPNAGCVGEPFQYPSGWWGTASYCRCNSGFLYHQQSAQCRPAIGAECHDEVPCVAGECNSATGLCTCPGFYIPSTDGLSCRAALGAMCATVECADENAECVNSICVCAQDFQQSNKQGDVRPICRKRLGAACRNVTECAVQEANCVAKTLRVPNAGACVCGEDYVPSTGLDSCLPVRGVIGGECSVAAQCSAWLGRHSTCTNSACACANNYQYDWKASTCVRQ